MTGASEGLTQITRCACLARSAPAARPQRREHGLQQDPRAIGLQELLREPLHLGVRAHEQRIAVGAIQRAIDYGQSRDEARGAALSGGEQARHGVVAQHVTTLRGLRGVVDDEVGDLEEGAHRQDE